MSRIPTDREKLKELAAQGDMEAFKILESLKGTEDDPFCHNSGKNCPAVEFCAVSQMAKKIAKGEATPEEELQYTLREGPVFHEFEDVTEEKASAESSSEEAEDIPDEDSNT